MERNIVFVGGAPRSGTTLVQRLLDSHPDVVGGPELNAIPDIVSLFNQMRVRIEEERTDFYGNVAQLQVQFSQFILSLFADARKQYKAIWISEKTPPNVLVFKELVKIVQGAKFIYVERDPKDVLTSYARIKQIALEKGKGLPAVSRYFFLSVDDVHRHMAAGYRFCEEHPKSSYVVKYADLVNNPVAEVKKLLEFLSLSYTEDVFSMNGPGQYFQEKRVRKVNSIYYNKTDISKPIDKNSIGKWRGALGTKKAAFVDQLFKGILYADYQSGSGTGGILLPMYKLHRKLMCSGNLIAAVYRKILRT